MAYYLDENGNLVKKNQNSDPIKKKKNAYVLNEDGDLVKTEIEASEEFGNRTWFQKGAFEDGYQFGDVSKTILGTSKDIKENLYSGVIGMVEPAIDTGAVLLGSVGKLLGNDSFQKSMQGFVEKDLIDEKKVARVMNNVTGGIPAWLSELVTGADKEKASVLGEKSDGVLQSVGQLAGQVVLESVGVPWYLTSGVTSFGGQAEEALREGATLEKAALSGLISAGAEILSEKLFDGLPIGGKTLEDRFIKPFVNKISNKAIRTLVNFGIDTVGEGAEEVVSSVLSRLGTKLYKEESIKELLTSEEATDEYIESFIGGMALSGVLNAKNAGKSLVTGRDYKTGLTENEQKVVEKEVETRIKEKEAAGNKLTEKEKSAIEEQVKSDLTKGYIGTDTIESVLGGKTYETYKAVKEQETALKKEIESLENMPATKITVKQSERLTEARKQLSELDTATPKEQLGREVSALAEKDMLGESYNEKSRRSQAFTADLSKYNAKRQEVVKKAAESGILNNTNRTHEFVDMLAKISEDKGVSFDFTNNQKLKDSGFALEGKTVNGFVKDGNISLNIDSSKYLNAVVGHEITHVLEGTELYGELQQAVKTFAESKGEYKKRMEELKKLYEGVEGTNIEDELTADLIGDYLFTDSDFVSSLSTEKPGLFKRIFEEIKYLIKTATARSKQERELEKVKRVFEKAYKDSGTKTEITTKFSIEEITGEKGSYGIGVVLDTNIFEGIKPRNWNEVVKDYVYNKLAGTELTVYNDGVAEKIYLAKKNERALKEGANNPNRVIDKLARHRGGDNIRNLSIVHIDELAQVSDFAGESVKNKHQWLDENGWEYRTAYAQDKSGRIYEMSLNIGKSRDGRKILYDINNIKEIDSGVVASKGTQRNNQSLDTKVSQDGGNVKYSVSDSAGRQLSEGQRKYFKDSQVRDAGSFGRKTKTIISLDANRVKNIDNLQPTEDGDIRHSLGEDIAPIGNYNVRGKDIALGPVREDVAPVQQSVPVMENIGPVSWEKVAEGFAMEYDAWEKKNPTKVFKVANTSDAMKSIGVEDKVITMDSSKLIKILSKHEGMTDDVIKRIPNVIHDPMLIVESKTNPSRIVMMGELTDAKGKTVLAVLELNPTSRKGIALDEIKIASTYGKDNLQSFVDTSKILYVNPNKQKTSSWITSTGLQLPVESLTTGSTNSIPQNEGNASEYKENVPVQQAYSPDELPAWDDVAKRQPEEGIYAPVQENFPVKKATTVKERNAKKLQSLKIQLQNEQVHMEQAHANFNAELRELQAEYDSKKNKNTKLAQTLLARMERRKTLRDSADADYEKRISDLKDKIDKMSSEKFKTAEQRQAKEEELQSWARELMGDTSTWKDKKWGLLYKINTLHRNLRDIVRGKDGKSDIDRADAIYDALQGTYNHNQAEKNRESNAIKESYAKKKITSAEDAYIQMLGEYKYNPDSTITDEALTEYYEKHKRKININKVNEVIESARKLYDELFVRVNAVLKEHGMKQLEYREGYFPHFTEDRQSFVAKLFDWKTKNDLIPTDIAGLTEEFKPNKSYQSFDKHRTGDTTDYSFKKGLDMYVEGALDWIYHIEDIQKRRAFENEIRYRHSEKGIQEKIEAIQNNTELNADEAQVQMDLVYADARNPLNNFVTDFRTQTNTLAGKKHSMDRGMEDWTNRKSYSIMTNVANRISANMVVGSISSALTNFIPITQSWGEVAPIWSLRAAEKVIKNFKSSEDIQKSDFLTNRLNQSENLYKTAWDKAGKYAGILMEGIDNFTSRVVWGSKYLQNLSEGMSENEAIKNADQFAENVMAGRSKGNTPTLFDAKNPLVKVFTAFQLEVNNQYGYLFKDLPQEIRNKSLGKLVQGYGTMFVGAFFYNMMYSALTGRNAALDPIGMVIEFLEDLGVFGEDEKEEPEEVAANLVDSVLDEVPFVGGLLGGGRIPLSSALPYGGSGSFAEGAKSFVQDIADVPEKGVKESLKSIGEEMVNPLLYLALPMGGSQIRKTVQGVKMFDDDLPIAGSYTDSGNLRFPVEDTLWNKVQAALFGQWASGNAREYVEEGRSPLGEKQIQELVDTELPIADYWKYRDGLKEQKTVGEKIDYIANLDFPISTKNILANNVTTRKTAIDATGLSTVDYWKYQNDLKKLNTESERREYLANLDIPIVTKDILANHRTTKDMPLDLSNYNEFADYEEFDYAVKHPEMYQFLKENNVSYADYSTFNSDKKDAYQWAYNNPEKYKVAQVVSDDVAEYRSYIRDINDISADKDENVKSINGSRKEKVVDYIDALNLDAGQKFILYKMNYEGDDEVNYYIVEYLNSRSDVSYKEMQTILEELGMTVSSDGRVSW